MTRRAIGTWVGRPAGIYPLLGTISEGELGREAADGFNEVEPCPQDDQVAQSEQFIHEVVPACMI